ncbi:hypothetical protein DXX93_03620 [Thalassotalea euphylliae]|uniref:PEP-CTERM sorting domain-containing protein n=1 Tax=Thalassotalea euphylliae TaxID=1655234 RepID=A0A3E0TN97_9GAMM|nr:CCXG family PEP-CTERM protein [Thalassotalea euphylliae]REL25730.1 hypothetical protein DXX93_03620 [Thalassotalea euphylliae]
MKTSLSGMLMIVALCCIVPLKANAALITYKTQGFSGNFSNADLKTQWSSLSGVVNSQTLSDFEQVWAGNQTFSYLSVEFSLVTDRVWTLEAGLDAGLGAQVYLDGHAIYKDSSNLWWAYNWSHGDIIKLDNLNLNQGGHQLEVFWLENCCNGFNSVRFTDQRSGVTSSLSLNALQTFEVPNPSSILLLGLALVGMFSANVSAKNTSSKVSA